MSEGGTIREDPSGSDLADLMEAIAERGDRDAFAALFAHYAPRLKGYLRRLSGDEAVAEELMQDVMLTVWRKAAQFDRRRSSVSTWLFTIARNRWIDALRRDRSAALDPYDPLLQPGDPEPPDAIFDAETQAARVRAALAKLPEEQIELVRLAFFSGISHSAIAERTGLPLGTVKSRLRLAFAKLRGALEGEEV